MRIAVFSDVQGNLPAMQAAVAHIEAWAPDLVLMNGDLVNRGPSSLQCVNLFSRLQQEAGWIALRGNHEDFILRCAREPPRSAIDAELRRFADWTRIQLGDRLRALEPWPDHLSLQGPNDSWVHVTHGTLAGNRDGISWKVPDERLPEKLLSGVDLFVTAHTHKPMQRWFRGVQILNVGSVGSPFDGDPRASYGQLEWLRGRWQARVVRLEYDRAQSARDFRDSGFHEQTGPLGRILFEEWRRAELMMRHWAARYRTPVLSGEISLQRSVREFLSACA